MQEFDVVIVGGAVTGSVLALALSSFSQHGMRIAIVEKSAPNYEEQGGFDARSIALAQGSLQKFAQIQPLVGENLGLLIQRLGTPIKQIQVSDLGHFGKTNLSAQEQGLAQLGVVVPLADLGRDLSSLIKQDTNIKLFCPDTVADIHRSQEQCQIKLASGQELACQLLVAADGIQSKIAQACGVETLQLKDYEQSAIIANVAISQVHQGQAFERFTSQGPLALLPLRDKQMSLVWCVKNPEELTACSDETFLARLQEAFGWQLGKFEQVSQRFVYPLSSQRAASHIHHRLAIVGNAAQLLHPVAGQGFNLGLRDLYELAALLGQAYLKGQDLGAYQLLQAYSQARQADQARIIGITSGLISLFSCEFLPVQVVRNLGLIVASHHQVARDRVVNQALGAY
ncbi:2-octaprenyl-6-methoxyphenyl hydroxylase [Pasteurellaceae bacterium RH1A]|nr:2-octaprenyl-6-methoxyphenyl hydroxylase [Pasteurellaceae bacterium RH1A]